MKTLSAILVALCISTYGANAQTVASSQPTANPAGQTMPPGTAYGVSERGPDFRVWQKIIPTVDEHGNVTYQTRPGYIELATGMHYRNNGQWVESKEEIQILPNGTAVAIQGQHRAYFPANIYQGAIKLVTPDGKTFISRPLGLSYFDGTNSVLIAELKDSVGELVGSNQVIYPDAFTDFHADLCYTYTKSGFEQDVILREQPPAPEGYGLALETTRLQVLTEFFNPPQPSKKSRFLREHLGVRLNDETLDFGVMKIGSGRAFAFGEQPDTGESVAVAKSWLMLEGRQFLVEELSVAAIAEQLDGLPAPVQAKLQPAGNAVRHVVSNKRLLPALRLARVDGTNQIKSAKLDITRRGFVLDYVTINNSLTNFTFQGDTTYYISGPVTLFGTNTFEGGTVLKYAPTNSASVTCSGAINSPGSAYRPAIFTARDDNSVGETILGSTGNPTNYYATVALRLNGGASVTMQNLRFSFAQTALALSGSGTNVFSQVQMVSCQNGISATNAGFNLRNALFWIVMTNFTGSSATGAVEQLTVDKAGRLNNNLTLSLTNCLLVAVTNTGSFTSNKVTIISSAAGVFQTVGAGAHYLAAGSTNRNAGTTNINPALLTALQKMTTFPPVICSNVTVSVATNFSPQAQRDTDTPDLGYHYDPIDYIADLVTITNAAMTVTNGAVIASYNRSSIQLQTGSSIVSVGTPLVPNRFVRYQAVQEQSIAFGTSVPASALSINPNHPGTTGPAGTFRFTQFASPAAGGNHLFDVGATNYNSLLVQDCEFWGGQNILTGSTNTTATLKNNLFYRSGITAAATNLSSTLNLTNNLVFGALVNLLQPTNKVWNAFNNDFDSCSVTNSTLTNGYNAYLNCSGRLQPANANDVVQAGSLAYQSGPLGGFYQSAGGPLIDKGALGADLVGLYHYTTQTNQLKETNSTVDIGYHYMAVDANGNPVDSNGDGIPDYIQDANGNGLADAGETNWGLAILAQPVGQVVAQGANVTFTVTAGGIAPLSYQWYFNGTNLLAGATSASLNLTNVQATNTGNYSVVVTNVMGSLTSSNAVLTVLTPPVITTNPGSQIVFLGSNAVFTVAATPTNYLSYRWYFNGVVIAGATNNVLTVVSALTNAGVYYAVATNLAGSATSSNAYLTTAIVDINSFNSSVLRTNGSTIYTNGTLRLTPPKTNQVGSVFLTTPIALASNASFSTFFTFRLNQGGGTTNTAADNHVGGEGIVFVVQTLTNNVGTNAGAMGYYRLTNSVGVEFDTWRNTNEAPGTFDPDGNHVGVDFNGFLTNAVTFQYGVRTNGYSAVTTNIVHDLNNSNIWYAWVDYNGATSNLEVRLSETNSARPLAPLFVYTNINLLDFLGAKGRTNSYIGFTASTGGSFNEQDILSWQFVSQYQPIGTNAPVPPVITQQPVNVTTNAGGNATFSVTVSNISTLPLSYQWWFSTTNLLADATNASLTLINVQTTDAGNYSVVVTNVAGSATSSNAVLTVNVPPLITQQPANVTTNVGRSATFSVTVTGTLPLSYQWQRNGINLTNGGNISGASSNVLTLANVAQPDAGIYTVVINNVAGTVTSLYAVLRVWTPSPVVAWGYDADGETDVPMDLTNAVSISGGYNHSLALKSDGTVVAWGADWVGQTDTPSGLTNMVAIAAGGYHNLALGCNGVVVGWGYDGDGETDIPNGLTNVVAIAAGGSHSLALKSDGTVVAWGADWYGQIDVPQGLANVVAISAGDADCLVLKADGTVVTWGSEGYGETNVPPNLTNVAAIAAGAVHSLALKADGKVAAWGYDGNGETDAPAGLTNVVAVAAGASHSLALRGDGAVLAWGYDGLGETDIPMGLTNVLAIAAGADHNLALGHELPWITTQPVNQTAFLGNTAVFFMAATGTPPLSYQWSFNGTNILGATNAMLTLTNVQFSQIGNYGVLVTNLYGSALSSNAVLNVILQTPCVVPPNGLVGWWRAEGNALDSIGTNNGVIQNVTYTNGMVGQAFACDPDNHNGNYVGVKIPDQPAYVLTNALSIECWVRPRGSGYTIFFRGDNRPGLDPYVLSMNGSNNRIYFYIEDESGNYAAIAASINYNQWSHVTATWDGGAGLMQLYVNGQLASQTNTAVRPVGNLIPGDAPGVGIGNVNDGGNNFPFTGDIDEVSLYNRALATNEIQALFQTGSDGKCTGPSTPITGAIAAGRKHTLALRFDGTVLAGGSGGNGQIGDGTTHLRTNLVSVAGVSNIVGIAAGQLFSYAWKGDGSAWALAWGDDRSGQLGNGTFQQAQPTAIQISNLTSVVAMAGGNQHGLAVEANGTVWAWGMNTYNQLGVANDSLHLVPVQVTNLTSVVAVAGGRQFSLALKSDGTVWGWGRDNRGELGDGTLVNSRTIPVRVAGLTNVTAIAAGNYHGVALSNGMIWTWGEYFNDGYQFPPTLLQTTPAPVTNLTSFVAIAAGAYHVLALKSNGTVWAWGYNGHGQLGDSTYRSRTSPVQVSGLSNVVAIAAGGDHSVALKSDGSIVTWGYLNYGQEVYSSPYPFIQEPTLRLTPTPPFILSQPVGQTLYVGAATTFSVTAGGTGLGYQWELNGLPIDGATNATLPLPNVQLAQAGTYTVLLTSPLGSLFSSNAVLTVLDGLTITTQLTNQTVMAGTTVNLSVVAVGTLPLSYQWSYNGANLAGATNATLTLANVQSYQSGSYAVSVTNPYGATNSATAVLRVLSSPSGLVAWWRAEGNASDIVGGNNGTLLNGAGFTNGEVGQTFSFSGGADGVANPCVQIPFSWNLAAANYTVEAWINPLGQVSNSANQSWIFGESQGLDQLVVRTGTTGVRVAFQFKNGFNSFPDVVSTSDIPIGQFSHVAGTWDGTTLRLYINGVLNNQSVPGTTPVISTCEFFIGGTYHPGSDYCSTVGQFFNGLIDELSYYNRALSSNEIATIYSAGSWGKGFTPAADSDYDGRSDGQEITDGTDSNNPNDVLPVRLGYWSFDNTKVWIGSAGQLPLLATNIVGVPSWSNNAVLVDSTSPALLAYRDVETNGNANINCRNGTVRFWFKPDWSSVTSFYNDQSVGGRLIELGDYNPAFTNGWWALYLNFNGTLLSFGSSTNGRGTTNLSSGIFWISNQWHQVVLTYTPTNSLVYLDGLLAAAGGGSVYFPNLTERANGFRIGSDSAGGNQAQGAFDELETFNFPLDPGTIQTNYQTALNLNNPVVITSQPADQTVMVDATASFAVAANGTLPLSYQWSFNGTDLDGETNATLILTNVQFAQAGSYVVQVANPLSTTNSISAILTVGPTPPGLIAWWRGESNALDSAGTNNGIIQNETYTNGMVGQAFACGSGGRVLITDSPAFQLTNALSIECWVRPRGNGYNIFWRGDNRNGLDPYSLSMQGNNDLAFYIEDESGNSALVETNISYNQWSHVAATWDGDTGIMKLYVNGRLASQTVTTVRPFGALNPNNNPAVSIGNIVGGEFPLIGDADEVSLYSRALKPDEVQAIYNLGSVGKCAQPPFIITQPTNQTVMGGQNASFSVVAGGTDPRSYQWRKNGRNLTDGNGVSGANSGTLTLTGLNPLGAGIYDVVVSNAFGRVTSSYAALRVWTPSSAIAWGNDDDSQVEVPADLTNAVQVAGGYRHSLALKNDGTVVGWGFDDDGEIDVPLGLTNVAAIAGGGYHNLALKSDGTVVAWGFDSDGQTNVPSDLTNVVAIAAGGYHSLALKSDGTVIAWGFDGEGQTDVPSDLTNVVAIAGGGHHSLALKGDGTVVGWGFDDDGEVDIPSDLTNAVAIAGGDFHSLALRVDGTITGWGIDDNGQTDIPSQLTNVVAIAAGAYHSLAFKSDGTGVGWGLDDDGEADVPPGLTNVTVFAGAGYHTLALGSLPPVITVQPQSQTAALGGNVTFSVTVVGSSPLNYQWYLSTTKLDSATNRTLTLSNLSTNDGGSYHVVITNRLGSATSSNAVLTVCLPPSITVQPAGRTAVRGSNANFTITTAGTPPLGYQWQQNGLPLSDDGSHVTGSTTASLNLNGVLDSDAGNYSVLVTNIAGSVISANAALTVIVSPSIMAQPTNLTVIQGNNATFSVTVSADSTIPLSYQWRFQGTNILAGATNALLTFAAVQATNAGNYSVVITNAAGSVTSSVAVLTVLVPPTISITNPVNNTFFPSITNITINAIASGNSGSVTQVQFYAGTILLGTDTGSPYSLIWSNAPLGAHHLTAIATDTLGLTTTSSVVNVNLSTNSLLPMDDSEVKGGAFVNNNYGSNPQMICENAGSGSSNSRDDYLKFNLNNINKNVGSVQLQVFGSYNGSQVSVTAYAVTNTSWSETNITWNNAPGYVTPLTTNTVIGSSDRWYLFDVTSYVQSQLAAGQNIISLALHNPTNTSQPATFDTKESSVNQPGLVIVPLPLSVSIVNPTGGAIFTAQTNITISATAADNDGTVTQVQFFQGTNSLGVVTQPPYNLTWNSVGSGTYALSAVASDDAGLIVTSSVVNITVNSCLLPIADAHVRDAQYANINYGTNITLEQETYHTPGQSRDAYLKFDLSNTSSNISNAKLNVFVGYTNSGGGGGGSSHPIDLYSVSDTNWQELAINWNNKPALGNDLGTINVNTASNQWRQIDITSYIKSQRAAGQTIISLAFHNRHDESTLININSRENTNPPVLTILSSNNNPVSVNITSPVNNSTFGAPADISLNATATDSVGTIRQVQFYQGTTSLGIVTSAPYSLTWSNAASGRYALTAVAKDDGGWVTISSVVNVLVDTPPVVTLTNPADNAFIIQGSNICLGASASDAGGTVTQVEFFQGTTSLGVVPNAPYVLTWSNAASGPYVLTARAMDNNGVMTTSAPVSIRVLGAPDIVTQPVSQAVLQSNDVVFNVTALGITPLYYQWVGNGTALAGQTNATLVLTNIQMANAGNYHVVVTNAVGSATSTDAVLTVIVPSFITTQPTNQLVFEGGTATFTVGVAPGYTYTYQWFHDGTVISGAGATLTISGVTVANAGNYTVTVSRNGCMAISTPATLGFYCCTATERFRPAIILGH